MPNSDQRQNTLRMIKYSIFFDSGSGQLVIGRGSYFTKKRTYLLCGLVGLYNTEL